MVHAAAMLMRVQLWGQRGCTGQAEGENRVCAIQTSMLELKARFTLALMLTTCPTLEKTERGRNTEVSGG